MEFARWFVTENVCALCDSERHLAHVVKTDGKWFAFDATHTNAESDGFACLGSFEVKATAMEAVQSQISEATGLVVIRPLTPPNQPVKDSVPSPQREFAFQLA